MRRAPEATRALILDAAERVFSAAMPDVVGLKEVAAAADVSHGLVTHYFGTYQALVEATLERRLAYAREQAMQRLAQATFTDPNEMPLVGVLLELVRDPLTARLVTWAILGGHAQSSTFFAVRTRGLALLVDAMCARIAALGHPVPPRERLELSIMAALSMALGLAASGELMWKALGHEGPLPIDGWIVEIQKMLRGYITAP